MFRGSLDDEHHRGNSQGPGLKLWMHLRVRFSL